MKTLRYLLIITILSMPSVVMAGLVRSNVDTPIAVADGGTGAGTPAGAASNLGLGTEDSPNFTGLTSNTLGVTQTVAITTDSDPLTPTVSESRVFISLTCSDTDPTPVVLTKGGSEQNYSEVVIFNAGAKGCSFALNAGVFQVPASPIVIEQYETLTIKYVVDRWTVIAVSTNALPFASLAVAGAVVAGGAITGLNEQGADVTGSTNHDTTELHGVMYKVTATATVTLDAAADVPYGGCASYRIRDAAEAVILDVSGSEKINLAGTATAAGVGITATGAGEAVTLCATTDTGDGSTDGYDAYGPTAGWASQ